MINLSKHSVIVLFAFLTLLGCGQTELHTSKAISQTPLSTEIVKAAALSGDGKYSIIADLAAVCVWNNQTKKIVHECLTGPEKDFIEIVKISKDNKHYITSNKVVVRLYSLTDGKFIGEWQLADNIINDIAVSQNASVILLGFRSGKASIIKPFSNEVNTYQKHRLDINKVSLSDDGQYAFTGSSDKTATLWQSQTGESLHTFTHKSRVNHVSISADAELAFSIDAINDRKFWNVETGELIGELDTHLRFFEFNSSEFSADKSLFLTGSPKRKLQLWRIADGELIAAWQTHQQRIRSSVLAVAFIEGNKVLSTTSDGMLELWQLPEIRR